MNTLNIGYRNVCSMKTKTSLTTNSMNRSPLRCPFLLVSIVTALLAFPLLETLAETASITIEVLEVFDYPGVGNQTFANKINDAGEIAGSYEDSSGVTRGYFRTATGHLSAPIVEPNDTGDFTAGLGINNSRIICGGYVGSDGNEHGFFLSDGIFTEYDVAGALATQVSGINDAGDFAGDYIPSGSVFVQAFVSIGGRITPLDIPGAQWSVANQLNASNRYVGEFFDGAFIVHGFYGDKNGASPFDPPDSTGTILFGLNDRGWIVGRYADSAEVTHGILFKPPSEFVVFDYPGSTFTSLNGINHDGFICGRYIDASGISHGILARARRTMGNEASMELNEEKEEQDASREDGGASRFPKRTSEALN
jgi:hypothetical protein